MCVRKLGIVSYGGGNLMSLMRAFERLDREAVLADTPDILRECEKLLLPGVGHFDDCMAALNASGLRPALEEQVRSRQVAVLGICVGYQMMCRGSEEGALPGLGWLKADVKRFPSWIDGEPLRVPHVGWNVLQTTRGALLEDLKREPRFYFTHSYYVDLDQPVSALGICRYGIDFAAVAGEERVIGVQFHPEKSHEAGLSVIRNFVERA